MSTELLPPEDQEAERFQQLIEVLDDPILSSHDKAVLSRLVAATGPREIKTLARLIRNRRTFYTFEDAGRALEVSRATVYRMVADGTIKARQIRRRGTRKSTRRIPATEIKRLVRTGTK